MVRSPPKAAFLISEPDPLKLYGVRLVRPVLVSTSSRYETLMRSRNLEVASVHEPLIRG